MRLRNRSHSLSDIEHATLMSSILIERPVEEPIEEQALELTAESTVGEQSTPLREPARPLHTRDAAPSDAAPRTMNRKAVKSDALRRTVRP